MNVLGSLVIRLGLDSAEFTDGMTKADQKSQRFAQNVSNQVAVGVAKAELALKGLSAAASLAFHAFPDLVEQAAKFQDLSEKTGETGANLASLAVSARIGGVDMDALANASVKLTKNLTGVDDDSKAAGAAIKALGLNLGDFKKLAPADQFESIGKALAGFEDGTSKSAVAVALLGKEGAAMLPFLKELGEGVGRVNILTAEQIKRADDFADKQAKSRAQMNLTAQAIVADLLPAVTSVQGAFTDFGKELVNAGKASDDLKKNKSIVEWGLEVVDVMATVIEGIEDVTRGIQVAGVAVAGAAAKATANKRISVVGPGGRAVDLQHNPKASEDIDRAVADDIGRILNSQRLSDKLRKNVSGVMATLDTEYQREAAKFARQVDRNNPKKELKFDGANVDGGKILKKQLDGQLQAIKEFGDERKKALEYADAYVRAWYEQGNTSLTDFNSTQRDLREAGLQSQLETFDKEIAALQAYAAKTKGPERIDTENKIAKAQRDRADAVQASARANVLVNLQEQEAVRQLADRYGDLRAQILDLQGDGLGAARQRITKQVEDARRLSVQAGQDPAGAREFGRLLDLSAQRNQIQADYGRLVESTRLQEEGAQLAARLAGTSELDTLKAIGVVRQGALEQLGNMAKLARDVAAANPTNKDAALWADQLALGLAKARAEADPLFQRIREIGGEMAQGVASGLEEWATGAKSLNDALKDVEQSLLRIAFRALVTKPFENWLTGALGGNGTSSGGGGILGSIFGSIFGTRAIGGGVEAGAMVQVNERSPELLDVNGRQFLMMGSQRGRVTPLQSGGNSSPISISIHETPGGSWRGSRNEILTDLARQLQYAQRNL